jgi:hypothetical protein
MSKTFLVRIHPYFLQHSPAITLEKRYGNDGGLVASLELERQQQ